MHLVNENQQHASDGSTGGAPTWSLPPPWRPRSTFWSKRGPRWTFGSLLSLALNVRFLGTLLFWNLKVKFVWTLTWLSPVLNGRSCWSWFVRMCFNNRPVALLNAVWQGVSGLFSPRRSPDGDLVLCLDHILCHSRFRRWRWQRTLLEPRTLLLRPPFTPPSPLWLPNSKTWLSKGKKRQNSGDCSIPARRSQPKKICWICYGKDIILTRRVILFGASVQTRIRKKVSQMWPRNNLPGKSFTTGCAVSVLSQNGQAY